MINAVNVVINTESKIKSKIPMQIAKMGAPKPPNFSLLSIDNTIPVIPNKIASTASKTGHTKLPTIPSIIPVMATKFAFLGFLVLSFFSLLFSLTRS